jgi:hypothetical protein
MIKTEVFRQYKGNKTVSMYRIKVGLDIGTDPTDKFIRQNFKEYKQIYNKNFSNRHNYCFNYALNTTKLLFVEDTIEYLFDNYKTISRKNIKINDIIAFADEYDFLHFAKVSGTDNMIMVRSKLGQMGIYEHNIEDTPIICGDRYIIFRKRSI